MNPRRWHSDTIFCIVAASCSVLAMRANLAPGSAAQRKVGNCGLTRVPPGARWVACPPAMVSYALRPIGPLAAWVVWKSMRVSLLEDLDAPAAVRRRGLDRGHSLIYSRAGCPPT